MATIKSLTVFIPLFYFIFIHTLYLIIDIIVWLPILKNKCITIIVNYIYSNNFIRKIYNYLKNTDFIKKLKTLKIYIFIKTAVIRIKKYVLQSYQIIKPYIKKIYNIITTVLKYIIKNLRYIQEELLLYLYQKLYLLKKKIIPIITRINKTVEMTMHHLFLKLFYKNIKINIFNIKFTFKRIAKIITTELKKNNFIKILNKLNYYMGTADRRHILPLSVYLIFKMKGLKLIGIYILFGVIYSNMVYKKKFKTNIYKISNNIQNITYKYKINQNLSKKNYKKYSIKNLYYISKLLKITKNKITTIRNNTITYNKNYVKKLKDKYKIQFSVTNILKNININWFYNLNILYIRKNKIFNKGRYSRNRQLYRTGVYWCLYINIIAIISFYFWFYKFSINFNYCWWLLLTFFSLFFTARALKFKLYSIYNIYIEMINYKFWLINLLYSFNTYVYAIFSKIINKCIKSNIMHKIKIIKIITINLHLYTNKLYYIETCEDFIVDYIKPELNRFKNKLYIKLNIKI